MKRGIVYLIYDSSQNLYKIGVTKGTGEKRLKQLQTGNASELQIIHTHETEFPYRLETMLHNKFKNNQILNEWYELPNYFFAKTLR